MSDTTKLLEEENVDSEEIDDFALDDLTRRIVLHVYDDESKEFTSLTTYHGMIRIYSSATWPSRIFWSLVVVTCLTMFMIHSGLMLFFYHSHPTFIKSTDAPLEQMHLPTITICELVDKHETKLHQNVLSFFNDVPTDSEKFNHVKNLERNGTNLIVDYLSTQRDLCPGLINGIKFGGRSVNEPCSLTEMVLTDVGYCLSVKWSNVRSYDAEISIKRESADMVLFQIHSRHSIGRMKSNGFFLPRSVRSILEVQPRNQSLLKSNDWGTCTNHWDSIHRKGEKYDSNKCERNCLAHRYITSCGCVPFYVSLNVSHTCSLSQMISCKPTGGGPACDCALECERSIYDIKPPTTLRHKNKYRSTLHISLPSRKVIIDEQMKRIKAVDLLSYVAGSMGLFLGMSCVTLLEIFIYLFKTIWGALNDERHQLYFDNLLGENAPPTHNELGGSYEQIVITTKVNGSERDSMSENVDGMPSEPNIQNGLTRRISIAPVGRRYSKVPSLPRSRSNTANTTETTSDLRLQLLRPTPGRRKSIYNAFGNF